MSASELGQNLVSRSHQPASRVILEKIKLCFSQKELMPASKYQTIKIMCIVSILPGPHHSAQRGIT